MVHFASSAAPAGAASLVTRTKFAQRTGRGSWDSDSELARVRMKGEAGGGAGLQTEGMRDRDR